jgi:hypothetical protein
LKKLLFIIIGILTVIVLAGAVTAYLLYFRQADVTGLWTGKTELREFMPMGESGTIEEKEFKDLVKLPVDVSLILKHEDKQVLSGKLTLRNFNYSHVDIPIDINGKIEGVKIKFEGENNMVISRISVDLIGGEVKNDTIAGNLGVTLLDPENFNSRTFRYKIELKRY